MQNQSKFMLHIKYHPRRKPFVLGRKRSKVRVKVTKNVKNTLLVITFDIFKLERFN